MKKKFAAAIGLLLACAAAHAAGWTMDLSESTGLPTIKTETVPVVTSTYIGWEANWQWAGTTNTVANPADIESAFTGDVPKLDLTYTGTRSIQATNKLAWNYAFNVAADHPNAIGYGVEFSSVLDASPFEGVKTIPGLLPNNMGWTWEPVSGETVRVEFSEPLAKIFYSESGNKGNIRAFIYGPVAIGARSVTMAVTLPNGGIIETPLAAKYPAVDTATWTKDPLHPKISPIDLRYLNDMPAGQHGFLKAVGDELQFSDGTPAKFWGTNVQAYALFSASDADIQQHAERIAKLGFNLVRLHHHDSKWVNPNIFDSPSIDTQSLRAESLRKLDLWIKSLKDQGVYVWLDMHVGRTFTTSDGIQDFLDLSKGKTTAEVKGFNYYNTSIQDEMKQFHEQYLAHVNEYTGVEYRDEPAVVGILITNENDLTFHFGNALLADKGVPIHNQIFEADADAFADLYGLSRAKVKQTWLMGESKIYLNDAEHRFNLTMLGHLDQLGVKVPAATTNSWGRMGMAGLPSLTDGGLIDAHSYGRAEEFDYNPRYQPGFLTWIGAARVSGKPLIVTEWNIEPYPARDRFTAPLFVASIASLQGWDALMQYGYAQASMLPSQDEDGSNYSSYNDAAMMALMPAAALMYREGHVSEAEKSYRLDMSRDSMFFTDWTPKTSKSIRTLLEQSKVSVGMPSVPELPWLPPTPNNSDILVSDLNADFIPPGESFICSDTGELFRDWTMGIQTIDSPKSRVVSGWIGGKTVSLGSMDFAVTTPKATVAVTSLDGNEIEISKKLLISVSAQSLPSNGTRGPFYSEPVDAKIRIEFLKGNASDVTLTPINPDGTMGVAKLVPRVSNKHEINLLDTASSHWYIVERVEKKCKNPVIQGV